MKKKYKLTKETIKHYGKTLYRIKALISFGRVEKGEIGGFIEKEVNLSHGGDAWVYGDARVSGAAMVSGAARVYGDARVSGDAGVSGAARVYGAAMVSGAARVYEYQLINIIGLQWNITICDYHLQIGCEMHKIEEWENLTEDQISRMDGDAVEFCKSYKDIILGIIKNRKGQR